MAAIEILRRYDEVIRYVDELKKERDLLIRRLNRIEGLEPYPSETNFVLVKLDPSLDAEELAKGLLEEGIAVQWYRDRYLPNHLRISVGTREMNEALLKSLEALVEKGRREE